jgi:hypothetical protein
LLQGLFELCVDAFLCAVGRDAHQARARCPSRDRLPDLELPFPQIGLDLLKAELYDPGGSRRCSETGRCCPPFKNERRGLDFNCPVHDGIPRVAGRKRFGSFVQLCGPFG